MRADSGARLLVVEGTAACGKYAHRTGQQPRDDAALAGAEGGLAVARERTAAQRAEKSSWEARSGEATARMADTANRLEEIEEERAVVAAKPAGLMKEIEQGDVMRAKLGEELVIVTVSVSARTS